MPNWEFFIVRSYATGLLSKHVCRVTQFGFLDIWIQFDLLFDLLWFINHILMDKLDVQETWILYIYCCILFLKFTVNIIVNNVDLKLKASYPRQWMSPKGQFTELQGEVDSLGLQKRQNLLTNCTMYRYINISIVQLRSMARWTNLSIN